MKGSEENEVDIAEKMKEARLRWYAHVIVRRDEGEPVRYIME
jgi:hypothetical protein